MKEWTVDGGFGVGMDGGAIQWISWMYVVYVVYVSV